MRSEKFGVSALVFMIVGSGMVSGMGINGIHCQWYAGSLVSRDSIVVG